MSATTWRTSYESGPEEERRQEEDLSSGRLGLLSPHTCSIPTSAVPIAFPVPGSPTPHPPLPIQPPPTSVQHRGLTARGSAEFRPRLDPTAPKTASIRIRSIPLCGSIFSRKCKMSPSKAAPAICFNSARQPRRCTRESEADPKVAERSPSTAPAGPGHLRQPRSSARPSGSSHPAEILRLHQHERRAAQESLLPGWRRNHRRLGRRHGKKPLQSGAHRRKLHRNGRHAIQEQTNAAA